jgi:hypothetical protein
MEQFVIRMIPGTMRDTHDTRDLRMIPRAASNTHDTRDLRMKLLIYAGCTHDTHDLRMIYA